MWWYDGGELPPDAVREPVGARFPEQGSVVVGTDGLLVLPHGSAQPFVLPECEDGGAADRSICRIAITTASSSTSCWPAARRRCSASFDYAGPLTESVLIGNVAAHFPGRDARVRREGADVPEEAGSQPVPDAQLPQRMETS